ncbi:MAG TPA: hypothetical protein VKD23_21615 [Terriglobales bacterium]|nr:hypothetical protein [Terriglobales bacterium]
MFYFREQRGSLEESLRTLVTLKDWPELVAHIRRLFSLFPVAEEEISVEPYGYDARIGWQTYIVTIRGQGVAGFCTEINSKPAAETQMPPPREIAGNGSGAS